MTPTHHPPDLNPVRSSTRNLTYMVDIANERCDIRCPGFARWGHCKHIKEAREQAGSEQPTTVRDFLREQAARRLTAEVKAEKGMMACAMCEARKVEPFVIPKPSLNHCDGCREDQITFSKAVWQAETMEALDRAQERVRRAA
jgi:hypothetical protein